MPERDPRLAALLPLAYGKLSEHDASELRTLKAVIQRQLGLQCDAYKESSTGCAHARARRAQLC
jgi:hypothetical protein